MVSEPSWLDQADRTSPWQDLRVLVAGSGTAGYSAAAALLSVGAGVVVVDERDDEETRQKAAILETLSAEVRLGPGVAASMPAGVDLVVASPGWAPTSPLLRAAAAAGHPILGEIDLAVRLADPERPTPWLAVANGGGYGETTTLLAYMLRAAGLRTAPVGNNGVPVSDVILDPEPYDALAVELSSHQLYRSRSLRPRAAVALGAADGADRWQLTWHGDNRDYLTCLGKVYTDCEIACVYPVIDQTSEQLVRDADVVEGCRAIGITRGVPDIGMLGVVEDVVADRAFVTDRATKAAELATVTELPTTGGGLPLLDEVLAAAALARANGVPPAAVRDGLADFQRLTDD